MNLVPISITAHFYTNSATHGKTGSLSLCSPFLYELGDSETVIMIHLKTQKPEKLSFIGTRGQVARPSK